MGRRKMVGGDRAAAQAKSGLKEEAPFTDPAILVIHSFRVGLTVRRLYPVPCNILFGSRDPVYCYWLVRLACVTGATGTVNMQTKTRATPLIVLSQF